MAITASALLSAPSIGQSTSPFAKFDGRWTGQGRLGIRDGKTENVTCRVTYFSSPDGIELKQTIRCATSGAKVEIQSTIKNTAGVLKGTWTETIYNLAGDLTGEITDKGFHVNVKGEQLSANMDLVVKDTFQIIEIQFHSSTLAGLTLMLKKG